MTWTPYSKRSSAMSGVMPNPAAAFSPFAMTQIDAVLRDERRQPASHEFASRLADDVADEEQAGHPRSTAILKTRPRRSFRPRQDDPQLAGCLTTAAPGPHRKRLTAARRAQTGRNSARPDGIARSASDGPRAAWRRRRAACSRRMATRIESAARPGRPRRLRWRPLFRARRGAGGSRR